MLTFDNQQAITTWEVLLVLTFCALFWCWFHFFHISIAITSYLAPTYYGYDGSINFW